MKKFYLIFLFFMMLVNIYMISSESSREELRIFISNILNEEIDDNLFIRIMHNNSLFLLTMYQIKKEQFFFESLDDKLKFRLVSIAAHCLEKFILMKKNKIDLKSQKWEKIIPDEVVELESFMQKERKTWAESTNELDKKLAKLHNKFIELINMINEKLGDICVREILDNFEVENEKNKSKEKVKEETILKFAEILVGYKSNERKIIEIQRLQKEVDDLKRIYLNLFG